MKNLIYICIVLIFASCSSSHEVTKTQTVPDNFMQGASHTKSYRTTSYNKIGSIDSNKPNGEHLEPPSAAFNHFKFDNKWTDAHSAVLAYFAKNATYSLHFQEQMIACIMLDEYLLKQSNTKNVKEAIAFYSELLIKNESSEVLLMTKALKKLDSYWEKAKLSAAQEKVKIISQKLLVASEISELEKEQIKNFVLK